LARKRLSEIIFFIFLIISITQAQFQTYLHLNQAYESNPFRHPEAQESWISTLEGGLQYNISTISLSYNGSYSNFSNFADRNYYWHQGALFASFSDTRLGIYFDQRFNRDVYTLYNYNSMTAYINQNLSLSTFNFFLAANGMINNYSELEAINNYELNASARLNKSFETRTTFILGVSGHYKKYTTSYSYMDSIASSTGGSGNGSGPGSAGTIQTDYQSVEVEAPSVSQLQYWVRIAQSLSSSTGLAAQYQSRINIEGATRYLAGLPYDYNDESEIFDDPMGYELQSVGVELTQIIPAQIIAKISGYYGEKAYTVQGIYIDQEIFTEEILRNDRYRTAFLSLQKNFSVNQIRMTGRLLYRWVDNESNSYWYNYSNHYSSLSLSFSF